MTRPDDHERRRDWVALLLAIAFATALNLVVVAVLMAAWLRGRKFGDYSISENATQLISGTFGALLGILGAFLGFRAGTQAGAGRAEEAARRAGETTALAMTAQQAQPTAPPPPPDEGETDAPTG